MHAHIHAYMPACIHTCKHTCVHTYIHTTCIHTYKHICIQTCIHMYTCTHVHIYIIPTYCATLQHSGTHCTTLQHNARAVPTPSLSYYLFMQQFDLSLPLLSLSTPQNTHLSTSSLFSRPLVQKFFVCFSLSLAMALFLAFC